MEREGQSFYENTNVSLNNVLLRWHAGKCCVCVHFLIADTYSEYNKTEIRTYLNRLIFFFLVGSTREKAFERWRY